MPALAIRMRALIAGAGSKFLVAVIHEIVLALFWLITINTHAYSPEMPGFWFEVLWTAFCCVELLLSIYIILSLCIRLISGKIRMSFSAILPVVVCSSPCVLLYLVLIPTRFTDLDTHSFNSIWLYRRERTSTSHSFCSSSGNTNSSTSKSALITLVRTDKELICVVRAPLCCPEAAALCTTPVPYQWPMT